MAAPRLLLASLVLFALASCREQRPREQAAPRTDLGSAHGPRLLFEPASDEDLVPQVRAFVARALADGRTPLVYVGASWCEPCRYFHAAAERGELDDALPPLALLELDRDRDGARLDAAGYGSRMIPLFVSPRADGTASERRIEGSIHGPDSPREIVPRLRAILPPSR